MREFLQSPLGCFISILGGIVGAAVGFQWLWPRVTKLLLLPHPGTSADNHVGAGLLAFPIAIVVGAAIGFVIPPLVLGVFRFIEARRNAD